MDSNSKQESEKIKTCTITVASLNLMLSTYCCYCCTFGATGRMLQL